MLVLALAAEGMKLHRNIDYVDTLSIDTEDQSLK